MPYRTLLFSISLALPGVLLLLTFSHTHSDASAYTVSSSPVVSMATEADSLSYGIEPGGTLIVALPDELSRGAVEEYVPLHVPPMSWLQDRSFMWKTRTQDVGQHDLLFLARFEEAPDDTLRILVEVALTGGE